MFQSVQECVHSKCVLLTLRMYSTVQVGVQDCVNGVHVLACVCVSVGVALRVQE